MNDPWELNYRAQDDYVRRLNEGWADGIQSNIEFQEHARAFTLSTDAAERKATPIASGCLDYFPAALAAVAALSRVGNEQHNPGKPLAWDRSKSGDEADALMRHLTERGTVDTDGVRHATKVAWRALALLQKELEEQEGAPVPRGCINVP